MVGWGQQKAGKVNVTKKNQLKENFATNLINWQQVIMIGYERES